MPNHVVNRITMPGISKLPLFTEDIDGSKQFDFQKLIPMPESLEIEDGSITTDAISALIIRLSRQPHFLPLEVKLLDERFKDITLDRMQELCEKGLQYAENLVKYGGVTWYDWSIANWGTKWNAYSTKIIDDDTIEFQTAWNAPRPIVMKLAEMYPVRMIKHEWADEDAGSNSGCREYDGTEWSGGYDEDEGTAIDRYVDLWGASKCFSKDEEGHWHRNVCDECTGCDPVARKEE